MAKPVEIEIRADDKASAQIGRVGDKLRGIAAEAGKAGSAATAGLGAVEKGGAGAAGSVDDLSNKITTVGRGLAGLVGLNIGTGLIQDAAATADAYNNLAARIKLATGEGAAFEQVMQAVQDISIRTSSSLEATGTLFARLQAAGQSAGQSAQAAQTNALALVETINQAVQLSGASAGASDAALTQLIQGLQSGVLRGEEFNSVMEQAPRLSKAMADGLGITTGELRKMAGEGRLTAEVVMGALKSQADTLKTEFSTLPPTIGRAIQNLSTAWTVYVGEADKASGASAAAASAIDAVAKNLDTLTEVATRAGAVVVAAMAVQAVGALRSYIAQAAAAGTATSLLGLELSKIPKMLQITVALAGFEAAYQLGTWLRETSQTAREFGVSFVDFVQKQVNSLQFLKEAGEAVFNDDTIGAALDRYNERAAQQKAIIAEMMKEASQAPAAIEAAAQKATAAVEQIGAAAEQTSEKLRITGKDVAEAFEAAAIAKTGDAKAAEANLRVQLQLAQQAEKMALYLGNETEARKAKILQLEIEIKLIEAKAAVQRAEAEGSIAVAQAKLAEMNAAKEINLVKQAELEASIKLAQAKIAEADATGQSAELFRRQLEAMRSGVGDSNRYKNAVDDHAKSQRGLASAVGAANRALDEQASKYARPNGGSTTGDNREQRLAGQNAVDNTLIFELKDKLAAGTLGPEDAADIKNAIAALDQNEAVNRDLDRMGGAFSTAGSADRAAMMNLRTMLAQALNVQQVGGQTTQQQTGGSTGSRGGASSSSTIGGSESMPSRGVTMNVNINGKPERFRAESQRDAQAIVRSLTEASRISGRG